MSRSVVDIVASVAIWCLGMVIMAIPMQALFETFAWLKNGYWINFSFADLYQTNFISNLSNTQFVGWNKIMVFLNEIWVSLFGSFIALGVFSILPIFERRQRRRGYNVADQNATVAQITHLQSTLHELVACLRSDISEIKDELAKQKVGEQ